MGSIYSASLRRTFHTIILTGVVKVNLPNLSMKNYFCYSVSSIPEYWISSRNKKWSRNPCKGHSVVSICYFIFYWHVHCSQGHLDNCTHELNYQAVCACGSGPPSSTPSPVDNYCVRHCHRPRKQFNTHIAHTQDTGFFAYFAAAWSYMFALPFACACNFFRIHASNSVWHIQLAQFRCCFFHTHIILMAHKSHLHKQARSCAA